MVTTKKYFQLSILLFAALVLLTVAESSAQSLTESLTSYNENRIHINTNGMYVLSGWALSNIAFSSLGYANSSGRTKYLHQMNVGWNIVNLAIAGGALYQYAHADPTSLTLAQSMAEAKSIENILLLNMGLNVGYIATGGFLWERGLRKTNNRLTGYGQSLIIQGGFLLLFDSSLYLLNRSNNEQLQSIIETISIQGNQLSISIPL